MFGEVGLRRILKSYADYYDRLRTHLSLEKDAPLFRRPQTVGTIAAIPILGGLHHQSGLGFQQAQLEWENQRQILSCG